MTYRPWYSERDARVYAAWLGSDRTMNAQREIARRFMLSVAHVQKIVKRNCVGADINHKISAEEK